MNSLLYKNLMKSLFWLSNFFDQMHKTLSRVNWSKQKFTWLLKSVRYFALKLCEKGERQEVISIAQIAFKVCKLLFSEVYFAVGYHLLSMGLKMSFISVQTVQLSWENWKDREKILKTGVIKTATHYVFYNRM